MGTCKGLDRRAMPFPPSWLTQPPTSAGAAARQNLGIPAAAAPTSSSDCSAGLAAMLKSRMVDTEFMKGSVDTAASFSPTLNRQARAGSLKRKRNSSLPSSMDQRRAEESPAADSSTLESSEGGGQGGAGRRAGGVSARAAMPSRNTLGAQWGPRTVEREDWRVQHVRDVCNYPCWAACSYWQRCGRCE